MIVFKFGGASVKSADAVKNVGDILQRYPESVTIFILPPSMDILKQRLENRGSDSKAAIERRLKDAENELASKEMYRHVIENDDLEKAIEELIAVVKQYR